MSERRELVWARLSASGAVVVAILVGIHPPDYVAAVVAFAFGLAAASFFPVIVLGVFATWVTPKGAVAGMVAGTGFTAVYIGWFKVFEWSGPEAWWFGISPEGIGTLGMALNFGVTWLVSRRTGPPPEASRAIVASLRGA